MGVGFATALLWNWAGRDSIGLMSIYGFSMVAGMLLLMANAIVRLSRGDVQLRSVDALKRAPLIFLLMLAVYGLADVLFPVVKIEWTAALIKCAIIALVVAFHASAYRKPA